MPETNADASADRWEEVKNSPEAIEKRKERAAKRKAREEREKAEAIQRLVFTCLHKGL